MKEAAQMARHAGALAALTDKARSREHYARAKELESRYGGKDD